MNRKYTVNRREKYKGKNKAPGERSTRRGFSKVSDEDLYTRMKADILSQMDSEYNSFGFTAEGYANEYNVEIHRMTQVLMRLNHDGLVSRKKNMETGEMVRCSPVWNASLYFIRTRAYPNERKGQYPLRFYSGSW